MARSASHILLIAALLAGLTTFACSGRKASTATPEPEPTPAAPAAEAVAKPAACADGWVKDDGDLETGYSYVPSANWGIYLQEIHSDELPNRALDTVCICWLRTRDDDEVDFDLVFYKKTEGRPADLPYAVISDVAREVPKGKESNGRFYDIEVPEVTVPEGASYVGVQWNPSADRFFFVCADQGPGDKVVPGVQRDDRSTAWQPVIGSPDPLFANHRAAMIRVRSQPASTAPDAPKVYNRADEIKRFKEEQAKKDAEGGGGGR